jgi:HEAT repeat protein
MSLAHLGYGAALLLSFACLAVVLLLVVIRLHQDRAARRRSRLRAPVWQHVLTLITGEEEEVEEAFARLLAATPAERAAVRDDAFALVPKVRGAARERLRDVLRGWGSLDEALKLCDSRSAVRRCRGIYRLAVLRLPEGRDRVVTALDDRDFAVRKMAMLAGGAFPDTDMAVHLLRRAAAEPRLRYDFFSAMDRMGAVTVPVLRAGLRRGMSSRTPGEERTAFLAAGALGVVGAVEAVRELERALDGDDPEVRIASIHALGVLGASSSVVALSGPLGSASADVRQAAARALGLVGGEWAVPALTTVLQDDNTEVARAAANALRRCGPAGAEALAGSTAPVAREVVALAALETA